MENKTVIKTDDGSSTIVMEQLGITYHSTFGALTESQHIFIQAGLAYQVANGFKELTILEMGFGTGLNALLTCLYADKSQVFIQMDSVEKFPISIELVSELTFPSKEILVSLHTLPWNVNNIVTDYFQLRKIEMDLATMDFDRQYDLIYYDAFAPEDQPELWTEEIFAKLYTQMRNGGILTTYCCKGIVKRALKAVGFQIEKIPGPPGKREFLRATK